MESLKFHFIFPYLGILGIRDQQTIAKPKTNKFAGAKSPVIVRKREI